MKKLAILAAVLLVLVASVGTFAQGTFGANSDTQLSISTPLLEKQTTTYHATAQPQFDLYYASAQVWNWAKQQNEWVGRLPIGIPGQNLTMYLYPNPLANNLAISDLIVYTVDLEKGLGQEQVTVKTTSVDAKGKTVTKSEKVWRYKNQNGVYHAERDGNGRLAMAIPIISALFPAGSHTLKMSALTGDGKRVDYDFLFVFHHASKKPSGDLVDTLQFVTEDWCVSDGTPDAYMVSELLAASGNGGSGPVFHRLMQSYNQQVEAAKTPVAENQTRTAEAPVRRGLSDEMIVGMYNTLGSAVNMLIVNNRAQTVVLARHEDWIVRAANPPAPANQVAQLIAPPACATSVTAVSYKIAFVRGTGVARWEKSVDGLIVVNDVTIKCQSDGVWATFVLRDEKRQRTGIACFDGMESGRDKIFWKTGNGNFQPLYFEVNAANNGMTLCVPVGY